MPSLADRFVGARAGQPSPEHPGATPTGHRRIAGRREAPAAHRANCGGRCHRPRVRGADAPRALMMRPGPRSDSCARWAWTSVRTPWAPDPDPTGARRGTPRDCDQQGLPGGPARRCGAVVCLSERRAGSRLWAGARRHRARLRLYRGGIDRLGCRFSPRRSLPAAALHAVGPDAAALWRAAPAESWPRRAERWPDAVTRDQRWHGASRATGRAS
jgi:hypothetical protein